MKAPLWRTTYCWSAAVRPVCGRRSLLPRPIPSLSVAVVSKVYPMRSHTVSAEGGAAGAIAADDTLDEHAYDTVSGSDWLGDQDAIEAFVQEAPRELLQLEHWGCPWSREPDGRIAVRAFGGMKNMRTWFAADKTGFHMLHTLFQTSLKYADAHAIRRMVRHPAAGRRRTRTRSCRDRADDRPGRGRSTRNRSSCAMAARARSSRSPPTPISAPATAWRWPTGPARH